MAYIIAEPCIGVKDASFTPMHGSAMTYAIAGILPQTTQSVRRAPPPVSHDRNGRECSTQLRRTQRHRSHSTAMGGHDSSWRVGLYAVAAPNSPVAPIRGSEC
jgi:hypothetical protein